MEDWSLFREDWKSNHLKALFSELITIPSVGQLSAAKSKIVGCSVQAWLSNPFSHLRCKSIQFLATENPGWEVDAGIGTCAHVHIALPICTRVCV